MREFTAGRGVNQTGEAIELVVFRRVLTQQQAAQVRTDHAFFDEGRRRFMAEIENDVGEVPPEMIHESRHQRGFVRVVTTDDCQAFDAGGEKFEIVGEGEAVFGTSPKQGPILECQRGSGGNHLHNEDRRPCFGFKKMRDARRDEVAVEGTAEGGNRHHAAAAARPATVASQPASRKAAGQLFLEASPQICRPCVHIL